MSLNVASILIHILARHTRNPTNENLQGCKRTTEKGGMKAPAWPLQGTAIGPQKHTQQPAQQGHFNTTLGGGYLGSLSI